MSCARRSERNRSAMSSHRSQSNRGGASAPGRTLKFEPLEDRRLLAIFTVTNLGDLPVAAANDAPGTLRQAVYDANHTPGADEIVFDGVSGTLALNEGELVLTDAVSITGPGIDDLTIDAQLNSRIFNITATTGDFAISDLTLSHGRTTGNNLGLFLFDNTYSGGAIRSLTSGSLLIENSRISDCTTMGNLTCGGALFSSAGGVTLNSSEITGNAAVYGGAVFSEDGILEITDSVVSGNHAYLRGSAIESYYGDLSITLSLITGNQTENGASIVHKTGGNATIQSSILSDNLAYGKGALSFVSSSEVQVINSEISGNVASGIFAYYGTLTVVGCLISRNRNSDVGLYTGSGIFKYGGDLTVVDTTITDNTTNLGGGGISAFGSHTSSVTQIFHSTITGNRTKANEVYDGSGGGIFNNGNVLTLDHTIVAGNVDENGEAADIHDKTGVPDAVTARYSLIGDNTGSGLVEAPLGSPDADGNLIGDPNGSGVIDPLLGPLADNGGWTDTHALLPGSPALNAGDPLAEAGVGDVPLYDQRLSPFARISGGRIDIGAFEAQVALPALLGDYNENGVVDSADYSVWRDSLGGEVDFYAGADGSGNGIIDEGDFYVWRSHFGETLSEGAGSAAVVSRLTTAVPQARDLPGVDPQQRDRWQSIFRQTESTAVTRQSDAPATADTLQFYRSPVLDHRSSAPRRSSTRLQSTTATDRPRFDLLLIDRAFAPVDNTGERSESDLLPDDLASAEAADPSTGALDVALAALTAGDDSGF